MLIKPELKQLNAVKQSANSRKYFLRIELCAPQDKIWKAQNRASACSRARGRHDGLGIKRPQVEIVILCARMLLNANKPSSKPYFREVTFV